MIDDQNNLGSGEPSIDEICEIIMSPMHPPVKPPWWLELYNPWVYSDAMIAYENSLGG